MVATVAALAMNLIHNERTKLLAGWLDRASTAVLTIGMITPLAGLLIGLSLPRVLLFLAAYFWLTVSLGLHLAARLVLGRLRE